MSTIKLHDIGAKSRRRFSGVDSSMSYRSFFVTVVFLIFLGSAHLVAAADDCTKPSASPPSETGQPRNLAGLKSQLSFYECSGAYSRDIKTQIDKAIAYVTQRAKSGTKLAIVLDIDETALSNWEEIKANDFGLIETGPCTISKTNPSPWPIPDTPCGFNAWILLADAKPLDTLRLFQAAKENKVAVFFITGRHEEENTKDSHPVLDATVENLHKAGYTDWVGLYLKPADDKESIQEFKTAKRKQIREMGYTIVVNVGDQYSDLRGGYAERVYKLPNPFYFVP